MLQAINANEEIFLELSRKMTYGAPELKQLYNKFLTRGLITAVALITLISISGLAYILSAKNDSEDVTEYIERKFTTIDPEINIPVINIPQAPQQVALKDPGSLTPEPVARRNVKENIKIKNQSELEEVKVPVSSEGTEDISKVTENTDQKMNGTKIEENIKVTHEPVKENFDVFEVERAPEPVNLSSVRSSMNYPEIARLSEIEGRVTAKVLVGTDGSVIKIGKISGDEVFRDEVAEKVMDLKFTPALKGDQKVKCWVSVPFNFRLSSKDK